MQPVSPIDRIRRWAGALKRDVVALWLAARDPGVPPLPKILAAVVAAYALSPIDLIPDFIPVLGYLDDLLIVPLGIWAVVRLIPPAVMTELRERAASRERPRSLAAGAVIVTLWLAVAAWLGWWLWRRVA